MIKARYERVALDAIGYQGGWGEVKINPTRDETREFIEAYGNIQDNPDDPAFLTAATKILGLVHLADDEEYSLADVKVLQEIDSGNGDPEIVTFLIGEFLARRKERVEKSVEPFRRLRMAEPERTDRQPEMASITYTSV